MRKNLLVVLSVLAVVFFTTNSPLKAQTTTELDVQFIEGGAPGDRVPGASAEVIREDGGLAIIVNTRHLPTGPFTVWLFFFECDEFGDCADAPTLGGPIFGTADTVGRNGRAHFAIGVPETIPHLINAELDEVHAVVFGDKPESIPMWERLTTPTGGTGVQVVIAPPP